MTALKIGVRPWIALSHQKVHILDCAIYSVVLKTEVMNIVIECVGPLVIRE